MCTVCRHVAPQTVAIMAGTSASVGGLGRPIVTSAPSLNAGGRAGSRSSGSSNTLPPLKQKTGIIKSKVPPPVPPRGSPKDARRGGGGGGGGSGSRTRSSSGSRTGAAGAAIAPTSAGSYTHLNDTTTSATAATNTIVTRSYVDVRRRVRPNPQVHAWLQTSDFGIVDDDDHADSDRDMQRLPTKSKSAHEFTATPSNARAGNAVADVARQRPAISTQCLQRELSVRRLRVTHTVPFMVKSFSNKSLLLADGQRTGSTPMITTSTATAAAKLPVGVSLDNIRQHLSQQFSRSAAPSSSACTLDVGQYGRELELLKRDSPVSRLLLATTYGGSCDAMRTTVGRVAVVSMANRVGGVIKAPPQRPAPPTVQRNCQIKAKSRKKRPAPQISDLRLPGRSATLLSAGAGEYI